MSDQGDSNAPGPSRELPEAFIEPVADAPQARVVYQNDTDSAGGEITGSADSGGGMTDSGAGGKIAHSYSGGEMTERGQGAETGGTALERGIVEEGSAESFPTSDPPSTMSPTTLSNAAGSGQAGAEGSGG